jgi:ADP-dependent NAD(P)H-hydrate dehydratase / NAD(P)H-hydrate epimerase
VAAVTGKRWLLNLAIVGALLLGAAGLLLLVVLPRYVEGKVLTSAEAQGVTVKPDDIAFGWGWVQLTQVTVSLDHVRSVQMQVGRIDVTLDGFTPLSIGLSNVDGVVTGSLTNVGLELGEWTKAHPSAYALPLSANNVHVRFVEPAGTPPWLDVSSGELTRTVAGGVFAAQHASFLGVDLGKVGAGFAREGSTIALGYGESDLGKAPFRVEVALGGKVPTATFTLAPTAAERLAKPLGIPLPLPGVIVSSLTTVAFAEGAAAGAISGTTSVTLKGYVPPHPFELDGFIFGDTTTFDTKFALPPTRDRITLTESRLKAGKFELAGDGLLTRGSDHSEASITLKGELPCSALASVEAESRLAKILGGTSALTHQAGKVAEKLIGGTVAIGLSLHVDTRNVLAAKVERTIGIGCGLHPLTLAELAKLVPLPADVTELLQNLPALPTDLSKLPQFAGLPSGLPPLPSGMPALPAGLPQLPNLGLPTSLPTIPPAPTTAPTATSTSKATPKPASTAKPAASSGG